MGLLHDLQTAPRAAIERWPDLTVEFVNEAKSESADLAGSYDASKRLILISREASAGRQAFTLLHELAHHLQQHDLLALDLLDKAAEHEDMYELEESVCNNFAAHLLFPPDASAPHFRDGVTTAAILALHRQSAGSLAAACVAAARYMTAAGQVTLLDSRGRVQFSCAAGIPPVPRGSDQSMIEPVRRSMRSMTTTSGQAELRYRDGIEGGTCFVQVQPVRGRFLLVATNGRPPWSDTFTLPTKGEPPRAAEFICHHCDSVYTTFVPAHGPCAQPPCTECGRCGCVGITKSRTCHRCHLLQPPAMFEGDNSVCRDCDY